MLRCIKYVLDIRDYGYGLGQGQGQELWSQIGRRWKLEEIKFLALALKIEVEGYIMTCIGHLGWSISIWCEAKSSSVNGDSLFDISMLYLQQNYEDT